MTKQQRRQGEDLLISHIEAERERMLPRPNFTSFNEMEAPFRTRLFERLMEAYQHELVTSLSPLLRDHEEVEDILQEVWSAFYKRTIDESLPWAEQFHILAWLKHIAKMRVYTLYQKRPRTLSLDNDQSPLLFEPAIPPQQQPEQIVIRQSISSVLRATIETLPPKQYQVLTRFFFDGAHLKEISQELAIPVSTVKSHLHRGLQRLRGLLVEQHLTNGDLDFWEPPQDRLGSPSSPLTRNL